MRNFDARSGPFTASLATCHLTPHYECHLASSHQPTFITTMLETISCLTSKAFRCTQRTAHTATWRAVQVQPALDIPVG